MTDIFLKLKNIQKKYIDASKNIQVLNGVNLSLNKNNIVSLIGPSGSGKSTLLHILGLLETCLLYTSPSPRDLSTSRMPSSA